MRESDRERRAAEQQAAADFLGLAHDTAGLWQACTTKACRRMRTCIGDADACGARRFPEAWAWIHGALRALRDGAPLCAANRLRPAKAGFVGQMRSADGEVIAMEQNSAFGPRTGTVVVHYPGLGESFEMTRRREYTKGRRRPSVGSIIYSPENMRSAHTTIRHIDDR